MTRLGGPSGRLCSLSRSLDFDGARTALYLIPVGAGLVLVLLVAGFFLLADLLLLVVLLFAAQSNLAFLGMWIESTRPDLAELLPFDADAGSSSNMVSSQPGRPLGLQSWSGGRLGAGRLGANFYGVREKRGGRVVDLRI